MKATLVSHKNLGLQTNGAYAEDWIIAFSGGEIAYRTNKNISTGKHTLELESNNVFGIAKKDIDRLRDILFNQNGFHFLLSSSIGSIPIPPATSINPTNIFHDAVLLTHHVIKTHADGSVDEFWNIDYKGGNVEYKTNVNKLTGELSYFYSDVVKLNAVDRDRLHDALFKKCRFNDLLQLGKISIGENNRATPTNQPAIVFHDAVLVSHRIIKTYSDGSILKFWNINYKNGNVEYYTRLDTLKHLNYVSRDSWKLDLKDLDKLHDVLFNKSGFDTLMHINRLPIPESNQAAPTNQQSDNASLLSHNIVRTNPDGTIEEYWEIVYMGKPTKYQTTKYTTGRYVFTFRDVLQLNKADGEKLTYTLVNQRGFDAILQSGTIKVEDIPKSMPSSDDAVLVSHKQLSACNNILEEDWEISYKGGKAEYRTEKSLVTGKYTMLQAGFSGLGTKYALVLEDMLFNQGGIETLRRDKQVNIPAKGSQMPKEEITLLDYDYDQGTNGGLDETWRLSYKNSVFKLGTILEKDGSRKLVSFEWGHQPGSVFENMSAVEFQAIEDTLMASGFSQLYTNAVCYLADTNNTSVKTKGPDKGCKLCGGSGKRVLFKDPVDCDCVI